MDQNQHPDHRADDGDQQVTLYHSVHHPRRVDVRIHGAPRSSLDAPVDEVQRLFHQVLWYAVMGVLTVAVAFAAAYYVQAKGEYRVCVDRNAAAMVTSQALDNLATAAEASGDKEEAAVLHQFRARRDGLTTPVCDKPPFTREYHPHSGG